MTRRRSHSFVARDALRHRRLFWLARATTRALRLRLGLPAGGPLFATLAVTWRCNYRCTFCDLPDRARGDPPLERLVERLRTLRRRGALAVGITGGEPLLHPDLFEVLAEAKRLGLLVHLNTNGSQLTRSKVEPLLAAGLHSVNVSLDGARPETHDALRGVPGSFEQIRATVRELLVRRSAGATQGRSGSTPRIGLVMAVTPRNLGEVLPFARLARDWGVDAAGFLPHHEFSETRSPIAREEAIQLERDLARAAEEVEILDNSPGYRGGIAPFLAGAPMPSGCSAGASHLAVDPDGQCFPCVPLMTLRRSGMPLEKLNGKPPLPSAADQEEVCRRCWWNCHRELDLSLKTIAAPAGIE